MRSARFANVLKRAGVEKGDRVALYLPLIPELAIAMLACARIGATHSVIFGGFSAAALVDRINDAGCKLVVTADGGFRRGAEVKLKDDRGRGAEADALGEGLHRRQAHRLDACTWRWGATTGGTSSCEIGRRRVPGRRTRQRAPALHPLHVAARPASRRASCTRPAATCLQTHLTTKWVFDLKDEDIYWCTADIGWVTGHSYVVYGPLAAGATVLMYEGAPNHPEPDRFWEIIERHRVTIFYTAPTAIRAFMRAGASSRPLETRPVSRCACSARWASRSIPEAWMWYRESDRRRPLPDRGHVVADRDGRDHDLAAAGRDADQARLGDAAFARHRSRRRSTKQGEPVRRRRRAAISSSEAPWPSMLRTIWGDDERYRKAVLVGDSPASTSRATARAATRTATSGSWAAWTTCINVSGHRLGTMEIESALVSHPAVAEAAVVGRPDELKGSGIVAFVTLEGAAPSDATR